eukprot:2375788-Rhodomonas_salina.1
MGGTTNRVPFMAVTTTVTRLSVQLSLLVGCVLTIDTSLAIGHSGLCRAYSSKSSAHTLRVISGCPSSYPFGDSEQAATRRDSELSYLGRDG